MFRRTEVAGPGSGGESDAVGEAISGGHLPDPQATSGPTSRTPPAVLPRAGGLDGLLTTAPLFHSRVRGYDHVEVDAYVASAEAELAAARREAEHLLSRYGACAAELEISRRLLAQAPKGRDLTSVSDRMHDILRLAADEASAMVESATGEADQLLAEARVEADARLRRAREVKELAAATADEMRELAQQDRVEAAALLARARAEVDQMVAQRDGLVAQAAEAREQLGALQAEMEDLRRRREDARSSLHRLTDRIEAALALATAGPTERYLLVGNTVESLPAASVPS